MRVTGALARVLASLFALNLLLFSLSARAVNVRSTVWPRESASRSAWVGPATLGVFVEKVIDGGAVCVEASPEQADKIKGRDPNLPLSPLAPDPAPLETGLKIILRGTAQLQSFPAAIEAFRRAAARWEAVIRTDVTIVIDVDFGPTLFGGPFDADVAASADAQVLGGNALYPALRAALISKGFSPAKAAFYTSLPIQAVPTDIGEAVGMTASSATLRALDLIEPVANPAGESSSFGLAPAIGVNSRFSFDFDPGDGIDEGKLAFESVALHAIGHVLGFVSVVGHPKSDSLTDPKPSVWDLFRSHPDVIKSDFTNGQRVLTSGGEHRFYAGSASLALSSGLPDGTGGDGRQGAHWKDDDLTGQYLGIMDPTIAPGQYQYITDDDLDVLDAVGWQTKSLVDPTTVITLHSGQAQIGGMIAPPPGLGVLSHLQYSIPVPRGATELRIDLNGNQDVDLFVRFGREVTIQNLHPQADYVSRTDSNNESVTVNSSSTPPLSQGLYYIAVANYGPDDADFTVTATVTGGDSGRAPAIFNLSANLEGDTLGLECSAIDLDGDFASARVVTLDQAGQAVGPLATLAIDSGDATQIESHFALSGLSAIPSALKTSIVLIDRSGNISAPAIAEFGRQQPGALSVTGGSYNGSKLKLKVRGVATGIQVEINGRVVAPPRRIKVNGPGTKLTIKGDGSQLQMQPGANRIRVRNANGWSNIFVLGILCLYG